MNDAPPDERRLAREQAEQARWKLKAPFAGTKLFDELLREEFLGQAEQAARRRHALARILHHAARETAYWSRLFDSLGVSVEELAAPGGLRRLPTLDKRTVREHFTALNAARLPAGETVAGTTHTTGTTGQPLKVTHTARSLGSFSVLRQRQLRWFRFDPMAKLAQIQPARDLPRNPDGSPIAEGETLRRDGWLQLNHLFETGPGVALGHRLALPAQLDWIRAEAPSYLLAQSAHLEQLALAQAPRARPAPLRGLYGISQTMTDGMRATIERVFGAPVHLAYGLNEFGIVAATCAEGGRYHVHAGHALVEIVDAEGAPARPGERGRILVSGLSNTAMPLFRYDTDDFAEVLEGPCACGRTLPAFGHVLGRYRRLAQLPDGTFAHWVALQIALENMPDALLTPLLQYQLYQRRDRVCELRLRCSAALAPAFAERIERAWRRADADTGATLELVIREGAEIATMPGGKVENLLSEFYPPIDQ